MRKMIVDSDLALLQSLYPLLDIPALTSQEEEFFYQHMKGSNIEAAAKAAGMPVATAQRLLRSDAGTAILDYLHSQTMARITVNKDLLTTMLMEAHRHAANATEEIMAIKELGKLHDAYDEVKNNRTKASGVNLLIQQNNITNIKQVQRMSDEELMALAGPSFQGFNLEAEPLPISETDPDYDPELDV
tara:strand:- start:651 stop:1214 length:564 start_codon:yes stop_codon:yes gene_type:complete